MKRCAVYFFYDQDGIVDDYVCFFLESLNHCGTDVFFVSNGEVTQSGKEKVRPFIKELFIRENKGFDVWAYRHALFTIGQEKLNDYDELIMMNHTIFGPIFPLDIMFEAMDKRTDLSFWGISKSHGDGGDIPEHIQSHFIAVKKTLLCSREFWEYWENCPEINCFEDALYKHEFVFTKHFCNLGYNWDVYVHIDEFENNIANPLLIYPLYCIEQKKTPIIKRKSFFLTDEWLFKSHLSTQMSSVMKCLREQTDYPTELIWDNLLRTQDLSRILKTMGLYHISGISSTIAEKTPEARVAIVVDLIETDNLEEIVKFCLNIKSAATIFVACSDEGEKDIAEKVFCSAEIKPVFFRKMKGLPAVWQENERLTQFEIVGYVNTNHVMGELSDSFRLYDIQNFNNLLPGVDAVEDAAETFEKDQRLGLLVSGSRRNEIHFFWSWRFFGKQYKQFCEKENVLVPISMDGPPVFYNSDFCWVRASVLTKLWPHAQELYNSGFETGFWRCFITHVLQASGYYTAYVISKNELIDVINYDDYTHAKWLDTDFSARSRTVMTAVPPLKRPLWKRILDRYPFLKAKLKRSYEGLRRFIAKTFSSRGYAERTVTDETAIKLEQPDIDAEWYDQVFLREASSTINPECLNISFLVPKPIRGGGGHRNIYRAVRFLAEYGHNIVVYHADCIEHGTLTKKHISEWFYPMPDNVLFLPYSGEIGYCDVCIACWWELAYELQNNLNKVKYPFYLVQDYEAAFYPMSSSAIMAENSYKLGFSHICSGRWCKEFLTQKYNAEAAYFTFPVNHNVYNTDVPRTKKNKNIVFFAKPEMPRRCYELGIRALALVKEARPDIEIILFGSNQVSWIPCEVTMKGVLPTIEDLANLYRNADLGVVFSTTNPSLVPYEMMLCGCPVVDVDMEQAIMKYGNDPDNIFLFKTEPDKMAKQILNVIDNKDLLMKKAEAGRKWVVETFPTEEQMGRIVESFIKNKIVCSQMEPENKS